jgi:Skp family chaperone for outer membrane proteins
MQKSSVILLGAALLFVSYACTKHKVEVAPVEVKPIHITIDVNVKVDRALDNFFKDIDNEAEKIDKNSSTAP